MSNDNQSNMKTENTNSLSSQIKPEDNNTSNSNINNIPQTISFYTTYGYIEINHSDYINQQNNVFKFTTKKKHLEGSVHRSSLKNTITIYLKTFHGNRNKYTFSLDINESISHIVSLLHNEESTLAPEKAWGKGTQYRLYSLIPKLREINPLNSFIKENIRDKETIIILPQVKMLFNEIIKGPAISVSREGKVATIQRDGLQYVFGAIPLSFGKHYFEIVLLTEPFGRSVIVGVCSKRENANYNYYELKNNFYGYILSDLKKTRLVNGKTEETAFGNKEAKINDKIGVLLEFKEEGLDISYYINKEYIGKAFEKIQEKIFYPCVGLGLANSKIMISNNPAFPNE